MDPNTLTTQQAIILGVLINAAVGVVIGLIPLILGFVKRNIKYGVFGFLASIAGGAILGVLLSIPAAAIFSWLIVRDPRPAAVSADPTDK